MFRVYDFSTQRGKPLSEHETLHEAFCAMEDYVVDLFNRQKDAMRKTGDPAIENGQVEMLLEYAIRRRFYIKTEFVTLTYEDASKYWLFKGIPG